MPQPAASLSISKSGSFNDLDGNGPDVGDTLDYTFTVTNDGNVTLTGVTINEDSFDLPGPILITPPADIDLSPGETQTWLGSYTLTQADIDSLAGDPVVDNIATATGTDPNNTPVDSDPDDAQIPFTPLALLSLIKDGVYTDVGSDGLNPGDTLDYTFTVTNDGNVTLTGVTINEDSFDLPGPILITPPADIDLSPGETQTWLGSYTLTQADIDSLAGDPVVDNIATATGTDPNNTPVDSDPDDAQIPFTPLALLSLIKDGVYTDVGSDGLNPGDTLDYTFTVTNDGNVTLTGVTINEDSFDLPGPILITPPADIDLSPGETQTWLGSYTLTQADIDSLAQDNSISNVASASGTAPGGTPVTTPGGEGGATVVIDGGEPGSPQLVITPDGNGLTVESPKGSSLWVEFLVTGAIANSAEHAHPGSHLRQQRRT